MLLRHGDGCVFHCRFTISSVFKVLLFLRFMFVPSFDRLIICCVWFSSIIYLHFDVEVDFSVCVRHRRVALCLRIVRPLCSALSAAFGCCRMVVHVCVSMPIVFALLRSLSSMWTRLARDYTTALRIIYYGYVTLCDIFFSFVCRRKQREEKVGDIDIAVGQNNFLTEMVAVGWPFEICTFPKWVACLGRTLWMVEWKFEFFCGN